MNQKMKGTVLRISLVGGVSLNYAGQRIDLKNKKLSALLGYCALNGKFEETRERIVGLFWSESDETHARASLRQALRQLRSALKEVGFQGFQSSKSNISFDKENIETDIHQVIAHTELQRVHKTLLNTVDFTECLMEGYEDVDPSFRIWILTFRQKLNDRLVRALESGLTSWDTDQDKGLRIAEALTNLDPTHETACQHIMRTRAGIGDIAGALRAYKNLWELLDEEYDMEPSASTMDLVADIKSGKLNAQPPVGSGNQISSFLDRVSNQNSSMPNPASETLRPVLFIDDFVTFDLPEKFFHLVQGFRHSLIASLTRFREWRVAETTPAPQFQQDDVVAYAVQTTAYVAKDSLHLVTTLKDLSTNTYVWSDRFEFSSEKWPELHHRIISRITIALNVNLSAQRLNEVTSGRELPSHLYDLWLRGQSKVKSFNPDDWNTANSIFRNLIKEVPDFSPAYSTLVQYGNTAHIAQPGVFRTAARQQENLKLAKLAVSLDPIDSRAHLCLGWANAFDGNFSASVPNFEMAIELNEYDPWTLISAAQGFAFLGEREPAKLVSQSALEATYMPKPSHWAYQAGIRFMNAEYEAALEAAQMAGNSLVNNGAWRAACCHHLGETKLATEEANHCFDLIRSKWSLPTEPSDSQIAAWILQLFPIRHPEDKERLRSGLSGAGVPVEDLEVH